MIADNDPEEQEKAIKFNHLVTNIVSLRIRSFATPTT